MEKTKCRLVWSSSVSAFVDVAFPPALLVYHYTGPTTPSNFLRLHAAHQDRHSVAISKSAPSPCAKCCQLSNLQRCFGRCCFLPPSLWRCGLHPRGRGRRETTPSAAVARIISTACNPQSQPDYVPHSPLNLIVGLLLVGSTSK